jgi:WD40 repeat protein
MPDKPKPPIEHLGTLPNAVQLSHLRYNPDGSQLAATGFDGHIHLWQQRIDGWQAQKPIPGHNGWASKLAWHPTSNLLFSSDSWGQIRCTEIPADAAQPATILWTIEKAHNGWIRDLAITKDGQTLATCSRDKTLKTWDAKTGKNLLSLNLPTEPFAVTFSNCGQQLLHGDLFGKIELIDAHTGKAIKDFDGSQFHRLHRLQDVAGLRVLQFTGDGKRIIAAGTLPESGATIKSGPLIHIFDAEDEAGKILHTLKPGDNKFGFIEDLVQLPGQGEGRLLGITSGTPGTGKLFLVEPGSEDPIFEDTKVPNPHALTLHPDQTHFALTTTNKGSNGNGRRLNQDGEYEGNNSPVELFRFV